MLLSFNMSQRIPFGAPSEAHDWFIPHYKDVDIDTFQVCRRCNVQLAAPDFFAADMSCYPNSSPHSNHGETTLATPTRTGLGRRARSPSLSGPPNHQMNPTAAPFNPGPQRPQINHHPAANPQGPQFQQMPGYSPPPQAQSSHPMHGYRNPYPAGPYNATGLPWGFHTPQAPLKQQMNQFPTPNPPEPSSQGMSPDRSTVPQGPPMQQTHPSAARGIPEPSTQEINQRSAGNAQEPSTHEVEPSLFAAPQEPPVGQMDHQVKRRPSQEEWSSQSGTGRRCMSEGRLSSALPDDQSNGQRVADSTGQASSSRQSGMGRPRTLL